MFSRFTSDARRIVRCAESEARDLGSPAVEAEHLLLALTWTDEATMAAAGLDREAVALALEAERERSLMAVGISAADFDLPRRRIDGHPRIAASARLALERAVKTAAARKARRIVAGALAAIGFTIYQKWIIDNPAPRAQQITHNAPREG